MARRKAQAASGETSTRIDAECDFWRRAPASVVVGVDLAAAWARARVDWPCLEGSHDAGDEACVVDVDGQPIMLLARDFDVSMFVHESTHVAACILRSRGVPFSFENEETVAHMIEWVVRTFLPSAQAWAASAGVPVPAASSAAVGPVEAPPGDRGTVLPR